MAKSRRSTRNLHTKAIQPAKKINTESSLQNGSKPDQCFQTDAAFNREDDDGTNDLANDIKGRLVRLNREAKSCKDFAENLRQEVLNLQIELVNKIDQAKEDIEKRKYSFRNSMLPIIVSMIQDVDQSHDEIVQVELPLILKPIGESPAAHRASKVVESCQQLITCYDTLQKNLPEMTSLTQTRRTFERDKDETIKAFDACKKLAISKLHLQLVGKIRVPDKKFIMSREEEHLARKIMSRGTAQTSNAYEKDVGGIGLLISEFGKAVGKMQALTEGYDA